MCDDLAFEFFEGFILKKWQQDCRVSIPNGVCRIIVSFALFASNYPRKCQRYQSVVLEMEENKTVLFKNPCGIRFLNPLPLHGIHLFTVTFRNMKNVNQKYVISKDNKGTILHGLNFVGISVANPNYDNITDYVVGLNRAGIAGLGDHSDNPTVGFLYEGTQSYPSVWREGTGFHFVFFILPFLKFFFFCVAILRICLLFCLQKKKIKRFWAQ